MLTQQIYTNASPVKTQSQPKSQAQKQPQSQNTCNSVCTLQYKPICAGPTNGIGLQIDFNNKCYLTLYNCQNPKNRKYQEI